MISFYMWQLTRTPEILHRFEEVKKKKTKKNLTHIQYLLQKLANVFKEKYKYKCNVTGTCVMV